MRIAHLTSVHPRNDVRIFLKECQSLAKMGHSVTLVVADSLGCDRSSGIEIVDVGQAKGRLRRMLGTTRRILKHALELDADVYHIHDPELLTICLALKRRGKAVVFDAHEDVPKQILGKHYLWPPLRKVVAWALGQYERYVCRRIDGIVAATPTIRDKFRNFQPNSEDINNYPILTELDPLPWVERSSCEVCYVGGIAGIRGIRELVRALELTQLDVRLNLVGGFVERVTEEEVQGYNGWEKVNVWGVQGRDGVRDAMGRSVVGLVTLHPTPNYLESLPIKMFEYMAAGIPVIASDFPLWSDILEEARCGVCVDPLNPVQIAKAIDDLVRDPEKARMMGLRGREAVKTQYNWTIEEAKLQSFYTRLQKRTGVS